MEELNIRILDQFVREEGSEEENKAWDDIRARAKANGAKPTLSEVFAKMQEESSFDEWGVEFVVLDRVKQILSEYFA